MDIFGASGHCKVILDAAQLCKIKIERIWDDNEALNEFAGYQISGNFSKLSLTSIRELIFAIGNNRIRHRLATKLKVKFGIVVHPSAVISKGIQIGRGSVIMAGVVVNADAKIGMHTILNTSCSVDHDCVIEDFVHLSPKVALAGSVFVGEGTHVGIGAVVIQGIKIGKWATIGAGAVVIRDVPDYAVVVGNPGRIIKYNTTQE